MKVYIVFILILICGFSYAQGSGDFDPLFGIDTGGASDGEGKVLIEHNNTGIDNEYGTAIYYYTDGSGKILVGGNIQYTSGDIDMVVTKLFNDGTIDTNFGSNGHRIVAFDLSNGTADNQDKLNDIQVDEITGFIYLVGSAQRNTVGDTDFAVARLTSDGDIDTTFATNGIPGNGKLVIHFDFGGDKGDVANSAFLSPPDPQLGSFSLYMAGYANRTVGSDFAITKIDTWGNDAGDIITDFGINGRLTIDFPGSTNSNDEALRIYPLRVDHADTIWVVGKQKQSNGSDAPALAFIDFDGDLQTQLSSNGKYVVPEIRDGVTIADAIKHPVKDNEFLFVGKDTFPNIVPIQNHECAVSYINVIDFSQPINDRFNFNLDVNEGTILELNSGCSSAAIGFNGKFVLAGSLYSASPNAVWKMAVMQLSSFEVTNGSSSYSIDLGFGVDGKKNFYFTDDAAPTRPGQIVDYISNVMIDDSQKILTVGTGTNQSGDNKIAVSRLISAGGSYPSVSITAPSHASVVSFGSAVTFTAVAFDNEDGDISNYIVWRSSIDGPFGTGSSVTTSNLSAGLHTISATITDTNNQSDLNQIALIVDDLIFKNNFEQ